MPEKNFSFYYNIKTKTGKMKLNNKYIPLNTLSSFPFFSSSSNEGYGINLLWEAKK